jgi:hypothetical protein
VRQQFEARGAGVVAGAGSSGVQFYSGPQVWTQRSEVIIPNRPGNNPLYMIPNQVNRGAFTPQQQPMQQNTQPYDPMNYPGGALGSFYSQQPPTPGTPNTTGPIQQAPMMNPINQSLVLLENQIFGHTYDGMNLLDRLNNLERQVFGRTYPELPHQQRINRLMRQTTYQQSQNTPTNPKAWANSALNMLMGAQQEEIYTQSQQVGW